MQACRTCTTFVLYHIPVESPWAKGFAERAGVSLKVIMGKLITKTIVVKDEMTYEVPWRLLWTPGMRMWANEESRRPNLRWVNGL